MVDSHNSDQLKVDLHIIRFSLALRFFSPLYVHICTN